MLDGIAVASDSDEVLQAPKPRRRRDSLQGPTVHFAALTCASLPGEQDAWGAFHRMRDGELPDVASDHAAATVEGLMLVRWRLRRAQECPEYVAALASRFWRSQQVGLYGFLEYVLVSFRKLTLPVAVEYPFHAAEHRRSLPAALRALGESAEAAAIVTEFGLPCTGCLVSSSWKGRALEQMLPGNAIHIVPLPRYRC